MDEIYKILRHIDIFIVHDEKTKREFFQAVAVSVLLYGCTTWNLMEKRIYTKKNS